MMPLSRLGCPLSLKTPNMGNTGLDSKCVAVLAVSALLVLAAATLFVMTFARGQEGDSSELTDTERLGEVGMLWTLEWPRADGPCPEDIPSDAVYNSHQELERSFEKAGGWRIEIGEMELVRERVERWRESYALWVRDAEAYAKMVPDSKEWSECKFKADTIAHRGRRALNQVDALLR